MKLLIFDNGGKTADRYTVVIDGSVYTMSENAQSPNGVNQYAGEISEMKPYSEWEDKFLGDDLYAEELILDMPLEVKRAIAERMERTIELPCYGITLNLTPDIYLEGKWSGNISSDLHDMVGDDVPTSNYNSAIDGLESIILAHACSGIDIESPAYIEGIETAVEAIGNNF